MYNFTINSVHNSCVTNVFPTVSSVRFLFILIVAIAAKIVVTGKSEEKHNTERWKIFRTSKNYKFPEVVINSNGKVEDETNERVAKTGRLNHR